VSLEKDGLIGPIGRKGKPDYYFVQRGNNEKRMAGTDADQGMTLERIEKETN
jgi:hypothetical protein